MMDYTSKVFVWLCFSAAVMPITIRCLEKKLKVDGKIARFIIPLGSTMNMDGTCLLQTVAAITIAQMNQIPLTFGKVLTIR